MTVKVAIIDYRSGNIFSMRNALETVGAEHVVVSQPEGLKNFDALVLPGVGAFGNAVHNLTDLGLFEAIHAFKKTGRPVVGVCLGMQLLLDQSDEFGSTEGLGLISGKVIEIPESDRSGAILKRPHIGWNELCATFENTDWSDTVLRDIKPESSAYFVHSFMAVTDDPACVIANAMYGEEKIPAVIAYERITACQFHPEKSGEVGLKILKAFCES